MLAALGGVGEVWTIEHRPFWIGTEAPTRLSWQRYADDLLVTLAEHFSQPVWLIGHSMGGVCSVLAAAAAPERVAGLCALDPVFIPDKFWFLSQIFGRLRPNAMPIVQRALGRPHTFAGFDAAFDFYRGKRAFSTLSDQSLKDYVDAAHASNGDGSVVLRWSGAWEACVYRSVPRVWPSLRSIRQPTLGLIGERSDVLGSEAIAKWRETQPHAQLLTLAGGHLLPLEAPETCASLISEFLMTGRCEIAPH
jgi:pimeloyl-ACP methyl ester carboxylesterase